MENKEAYKMIYRELKGDLTKVKRYYEQSAPLLDVEITFSPMFPKYSNPEFHFKDIDSGYWYTIPLSVVEELLEEYKSIMFAGEDR